MNFYLPLASFALSVALTPVVRACSVRLGWMAAPRQDRWHKRPTALMGGIAIFLAVAVPLAFLADFKSLAPLIRFPGSAGRPALVAVLWLGMTLVFVLGVVDDRLRLKPHTKLIGQILVASMVIFFGFRLRWFHSMTLDTLASLVWIVGITNATNLIDNMDGLCAGTGLIAAATLAVLYFDSAPEAADAALMLAGALAGFLIYNFNPASIFMGDCGSLPVGFALAMLTLAFPVVSAKTELDRLALPVLVLLVPILDTTLVTLVRLLSGRKPSTGGRDHTSHRLVLMGLNEARAVVFLYGVGLVSGLAAVFVRRSDSITAPSAILPLAVAVLLMGIYLSQLRVYPDGGDFSALKGKAYTPVLLELTHRRHLLMVALDFFLVAFSYYLSYRLRFEGTAFGYYFHVFLRSLPVVIACKLAVFFTLGVYRGLWGYMSSSDVFVMVKASVAASLLAITGVTFIYRFIDFSKGTFLIDWLITTGMLLGTRGSFRLFVESVGRGALTGDAVLIYGAGRGGEILVREILNNPVLKVKPVGFIDDDRLKTGRKIHGLPVLGTFSEIDAIVDARKVRGLIVSFRKEEAGALAPITSFCRKNGLFLKRFTIGLEHIDLD